MSVDPQGRRMFIDEHRRRVERMQRFAEHIVQNAGWLRKRLDDAAPDDLKSALDSMNFADAIASDATEIVRLEAEVWALRSVSFLLDGES